MTTDELLEILKERGLEIVRRGDNLRLRGPAGEKTPALLAVLKIHRERLLDRIPDQPVCASEAQPEPGPEPVQEPIPLELGEEMPDGEYQLPFWFEYLWPTGHTKICRVGYVPLACWWVRQVGPGIPVQPWEPLPDCPTRLRDHPPQPIRTGHELNERTDSVS